MLAKKPLNKKSIRFVIVGVLNTIIDFGLINLLSIFGLNLIVANTFSTGTAMLFSFFANKKWTFNADGNYIKQIVLFFIFTAIGIWVIQNLFLYLITKYIPNFGIDNIIFNNIAKILASIPSLIWNYFTYNYFVFKSKKSD